MVPQAVICPVLGTITEKSIGPMPIPHNTDKYWPIPNAPKLVSFKPYSKARRVHPTVGVQCYPKLVDPGGAWVTRRTTPCSTRLMAAHDKKCLKIPFEKSIHPLGILNKLRLIDVRI